ncbi:hypothetical protein PN823_004423 [Enterobacter hormaechei]|nr:hypothetical protein [Enterobacter hormaechei]
MPDPVSPATPTISVDAHNYNLGRDYILPPQVDDAGNSVITGKPPLSINQVIQNESDAIWEAQRTDARNVDPNKGDQGPYQQPKWDWKPNTADGSLPKPVSIHTTPNGVIVPSTQEDFEKNMAAIWVPNPEDLPDPSIIVSGTPIQPRPRPAGDALPVTQPEYDVPKDFGAVESAIPRPPNTTALLPHEDKAELEQGWDWNPQRAIYPLAQSMANKLVFTVGTTKGLNELFEKGVPTDELVYQTDKPFFTFKDDVITATAVGTATITASVKRHPEVFAKITLTVKA